MKKMRIFHQKTIWITFGVVVFFVVLGIGAFIQWVRYFTPERQTIVIVADPFLIVSFNSRKQQFTVAKIPGDTRIDAVHGYGKYPLASLWKLDRIDKRGGTLFIKSLEESLSLPIDGYIDPFGQAIPQVVTSDSLSFIRRSFSLWVPFQLLYQKRTNVPFFSLIAFAVNVASTRFDAFVTYDADRLLTLYDETLPDGSVVRSLDAERFRVLLANSFEYTTLRIERLKVGIYNTTATPLLGQRISQTLEQLGMFVIFIANDEPVTTTCEVVARPEYKKSQTVQLLLHLYDCLFVSSTALDSRDDVSLRIGNAYESLFVPY